MFQPDKLADLISKPAQKADPFSLRSLVEWLERQDGAKEYDADSPRVCLLGQYVAAVGGSYSPGSYTIGQLCVGTIGGEGLPMGTYSTAIKFPHTFGAALQRARNLLSEGRE